MALEKAIVAKKVEYPHERMDWDLAERWAEEIPVFSENDPDNPEWKITPCSPIDLTPDGGTVYIKDESKNPTGTIKDRPAWELVTLYRDLGKMLWLKKRENILNGNVGHLTIPRLSIITAGNVGSAVSHAFQKYGLPPINLLVDSNISRKRLDALKELYANIFLFDLNGKELSSKEIREITENKDGVDITSVMSIRPQQIFYDWHVHEVFNESPDQIYVPYGSGRLFENYLSWQEISARNFVSGRKDPRLKVPVWRIANIDIMGAEPGALDSVACKLTKRYNPFRLFDDSDIRALGLFSFSGENSGVHKVSEERIKQAYEILTGKGVEAEHSSAAATALYLDRWEKGLVNHGDKVVIVNTGKGI